MKISLREITQEDIRIIKPWLINKENAKWLDSFFQNDGLSDIQLALFLIRKDKKTYMIMCDDIPVGVIGLTEINEINRSSGIWVLVGDRSYRRKGVCIVSMILILKKAFYDLNLHSVNTWAPEEHFTWRVFIKKIGFKMIGRQRECYMMDGQLKDLILIDILKNDLDESALLQHLEQTG